MSYAEFDACTVILTTLRDVLFDSTSTSTSTLTVYNAFVISIRKLKTSQIKTSLRHIFKTHLRPSNNSLMDVDNLLDRLQPFALKRLNG